MVTVATSPGLEVSTVSVQNSFGKIVKQTDDVADKGVSVDISDLLPGVYFISVNKGGQLFKVKVLKN